MYTINRLKMENFKLIDEEKIIDFQGNNLIVLDGPNGYGKTTIFDAIEILIKGSRNIDEQYMTEYREGDKPVFFANDITQPVRITGEFINSEGNSFIIMRVIFKPDKLGKISDLSNRFETFRLKNFDDLEGETISQDSINCIFNFAPTETIYNLMHYIQQEETLFFLKKNENARREEINKLFNMSKESIEREKLVKIRKKLSERKDSLKEKIEKTKIELDKYQLDDNNNIVENIEYEKILPWKNVIWDQSIFDVEPTLYYKIQNEITILKNIVINKEDIHRYKFNKKIDFCLNTQNEEILKGAIIILNYIDRYDYLSIKDTKNKLINNFINVINDAKYSDIKIFLELNKEFLIDLNLEINFDEMYNLIINIIELKNDSSMIDLLIIEINKTRNSLKISYERYIEYDKTQENICPLCGYDYSDNNLFVEMEKKEKYFINRLNEISKKIEIISKKLQMEYFSTIIKRIDILYSNRLNEEIFYKEFEKYYLKKDRIKNLELYLDTVGIQLNEYCVNEMTYEEDKVKNQFEKLIMNISEKIEDIQNIDFIYENSRIIENIISTIFDNKLENLNKITIEQLEKKEKYLSNLYFQTKILKINKLKNELEYLQKQAMIITEYYNNSNKILNIYTTEIRQYSEYMVNMLQIPLYIYTGKIIQNYQGGLGVFIKTEDINQQIRLKFVNDNTNKHDVIKLFSSGQLSGLVISLVLALNRVFSKDNLNMILIDDPIQNMDDINMASFVELLRNEFKDKQIILSTHDERISRFIRYKYEKFGISNKRYNVKEQMN